MKSIMEEFGLLYNLLCYTKWLNSIIIQITKWCQLSEWETVHGVSTWKTTAPVRKQTKPQKAEAHMETSPVLITSCLYLKPVAGTSVITLIAPYCNW